MDPILSLLSGAGPFGNPWQPRPPSFGGIPGLGGMGNGIAGMFLQSLLPQFQQSHGQFALNFMGTQNLADTMQAQTMMMERQAAMTQAAQADRLQFINMARGATTMMGGDFTAGHEAAAGRLSGVMAQMSPFLATMMPDFYDRMFGQRGSAAVMASGMFQGARFQTDPVTGLPGMSGDSVGQISRQLYTDLYRTDADMRQMRGVSAGQVGQMYDELSRRGFMGGADRSMRAGKLAGMSEEDVGFMGEDNGRRADEVRRIGDKMKGLAGVVAAMKDVFGDAGHPDAPISQIINGLQALTQGGLAQMSPEQMRQQVRQTQQLGRLASVDLNGMMQLTAQGAGLADQMGLNRQFAVAATQHALGFAAAFPMEQTPQFGALDKAAAMSLDQQLTMSAAKSPLTSHLSAIMAMRAMYGSREGFAGSQLDLAAQAIERGEMPAMGVGFKNIVAAAQGSGISASEAAALIQSPAALQPFAAQYNVAAITRQQQFGIDIAPMYRSGIGNALRLAGIGNTALATALANAIPEAQLHRLAPEQRAAALMAAVDPALLHGEDLQKIEGAINSGIARTDQFMSTDRRFSAYGGIVGVSQMMDRSTERRRQELDLLATSRGNIASDLAGLGQGGIFRNFADALGGNKNLTGMEFLMKVFGGGVKGDEVTEALGKQLDAVIPLIDALGTTKDPAERAKIRKELDYKYGGMEDTIKKLEATSPEMRKKLSMYRAGDDANVVGSLVGLGAGAGAIRKALAMATPEQRLRLMEAGDRMLTMSTAAGQAASAWGLLGDEQSRAEDSLLRDAAKTGDVRDVIKNFIGDGGLKAAGMGPQEVIATFAPNSVLKVEGSLTFDKDGMMKLQGSGTPANRSSTRQ